jgi:type I restriction enzyme S subunit
MDFDERDRAKYLLHPGDVLICEGGEPGRAAVWRGEIAECYFQKAVHRGRPVDRLATGDFLVHLLAELARRGGLLDHISSATISHLTGERLKSMGVIAPPFESQVEFGQKAASLRSLRESASTSLAHFDNMFGALQHRAFRGGL